MFKCTTIFFLKTQLECSNALQSVKKSGMFVQSLLTIIFKKTNLLKLIFNFEDLLHSPNNKSIVYTYMIWLESQNCHELIQVMHTQLTSSQISQHLDIVKKIQFQFESLKSLKTNKQGVQH